MTMPSQRLYDISYNHIGQHLSLDESIPHELGCAQAVSYVLNEFGSPIPSKGLSGTGILFDWLKDHFEEVPEYELGAVIISVTGSGLPGTHGHVGICGHNAIMSNDSESGLWQPYWSKAGWVGYYQTKLDMKVHYFLPK